MAGGRLAALLALAAAVARADDDEALPPYPYAEAGGALAAVVAGHDADLRLALNAGRFLGPHQLEARLAASRWLSSNVVDADLSYAWHFLPAPIMPFVRGAIGTRLDFVGGGGSRLRLALSGGVGLKAQAGDHFLLRVELDYRHFFGAPGIASEATLWAGPGLVW